jgi:hypothetical protein
VSGDMVVVEWISMVLYHNGKVVSSGCLKSNMEGLRGDVGATNDKVVDPKP